MRNPAPEQAIRALVSPPLLYGTAWKEERTEQLTLMALQAGFRGIDTANQRKHYFEAAVGAALGAAQSQGLVRREQLFLQSKFTFKAGQDHRLPYDSRAPIETQLQQSLTSSLEHLRTDYLDAYLLHGPSRRHGLGPDDHAAWRALEKELEAGRTRLIGVSNVSAEQLEAFIGIASRPPQVVQNRCYASQAWDLACRQICRRHGILYQGFSLLTANRRELQHPVVLSLASRYRIGVPEVVFRRALASGILPLTGTTRLEHMRQDLASCELAFDPPDSVSLENLALG